MRAHRPPRLIYFSLEPCRDTIRRTCARSPDPLAEALDVIGLNEYLGWYWGRVEDADKMQWKSKYDKPLIMSESAAGALSAAMAMRRALDGGVPGELVSASVADGAEGAHLLGLTPWC